MVGNKRLFELDALRGLAALSVCLFHFNCFKYGVTGVDLFFIISGFVIFMSISNSKSVGDFVFSRLIRLYPAYWFSLLIAIIAFYFVNKNMPSHNPNYVIGNLLMLQPLFRAGNLVDVYWTLYVEIIFYIFIILLWYLKQLKNIEIVICVVLLLMIMINGSYLLFRDRSPLCVRLFITTRGVLPLISHFNFFAAGIIFYQIYTKKINALRLILLFVSFAITALVHNIGGRVFYFLNINQHLYCSAVYYAIFILFIYKKLSFLNKNYFTFLGSISYPLYLIHQSFGIALKDYMTPGIGLGISVGVAIISSIILSYFITYYFDIPVRARLKKIYRIKTTQLTVT